MPARPPALPCTHACLHARAQWSLSRPMLPLILAAEPVYADIQAQLRASQPPERQGPLATCLDKLMVDVQVRYGAARMHAWRTPPPPLHVRCACAVHAVSAWVGLVHGWADVCCQPLQLPAPAGWCSYTTQAFEWSLQTVPSVHCQSMH